LTPSRSHTRRARLAITSKSATTLTTAACQMSDVKKAQLSNLFLVLLDKILKNKNILLLEQDILRIEVDGIK